MSYSGAEYQANYSGDYSAGASYQSFFPGYYENTFGNLGGNYDPNVNPYTGERDTGSYDKNGNVYGDDGKNLGSQSDWAAKYFGGNQTQTASHGGGGGPTFGGGGGGSSGGGGGGQSIGQAIAQIISALKGQVQTATPAATTGTGFFASAPLGIPMIFWIGGAIALFAFEGAGKKR